VEPFVSRVKAGVPTLGICLGMHLVFSESEEFGLHRGLDLLPGRVRRIPEGVSVPHMGWNQLHLKKQDPLLAGIEPGSFVYFVHSFYVEPAAEEITLASTDHGIEFAAIVHKDNVWATQFHPEKSQKVGERLLDNFARV
jgi:glutamine amidotransferase